MTSHEMNVSALWLTEIGNTASAVVVYAVDNCSLTLHHQVLQVQRRNNIEIIDCNALNVRPLHHIYCRHCQQPIDCSLGTNKWSPTNIVINSNGKQQHSQWYTQNVHQCSTKERWHQLEHFVMRRVSICSRTLMDIRRVISDAASLFHP